MIPQAEQISDRKFRLPNTGAGYDFPVPLDRLPVGTRFMSHSGFAWGLKPDIYTGTLLWLSPGSAEIWWDHDKDTSRCTRDLNVWILDEEPLTQEQIDELLTQSSNGDKNDTMANTDPQTPTKSSNPVISALYARYNFQLKALAEALDGEDKAKAQIILVRIEKVVREAAQMKVKLPENIPASLVGYEPLEAVLKPKQAEAPPAAEEPTQKEANAQRHADRAAAKEKHINEVQGAKAAKTPKPKSTAEKKLQPCLDGCGQMVPGNFQMGHDAKLKSILIKVERGDLPLDAIPEPALDLVKIVKAELIQERDSQGNPKGDPKQTYRITAAPVRFPGRPEIVLTKRED